MIGTLVLFHRLQQVLVIVTHDQRFSNVSMALRHLLFLHCELH